MSNSYLRPLVVILGPTASGKSALAIALAREHAGEIVNCDSVQLYRGFDIGAAKLPPAEWHDVAHHLFDIAGPDDDFTAGDYSRAARQTLDAISERRHLPIICGGSGFYLRALLSGLSPAPPRDRQLRERLSNIARRRPTSLHWLFNRIDRKAASQIHPNDLQKLIRALEMACRAGAPASRVQAQPRDALTGYRTLKIGLDPERKELYRRIDLRSAAMFRDGLIDETTKLLQSGYARSSKPTQSLGYAQALRYLSGEHSMEAAIADCQTRTRQYAKRQMTWFRAESDVQWLSGFGSQPQIAEQARRLVADFL